MGRTRTLLLAAACLSVGVLPASAETVMQQCGQQYQAAKAAGTLNGMNWGQFRSDCATRLKGQPASASAPAASPPAGAPVAAPAATTAAAPVPPAAAPATVPPATAPGATAPKAPASGGRAAMLVRQKQCGAEWRSQKVTLVAQTPGLTWPKYWSQCNTRLKAAGQ